MINYLHLSNFRAFKDLQLRFAALNIFVGPNNSGKSSAISAINLIAQNVKRDRRGSGLALTGNYTDLGSYYDVVYGHKANSNMKIAFGINGIDYEYNFRYRLQRRQIELYKASINNKSAKYTFSLTKEGSEHAITTEGKRGSNKILGVRPRLSGLTFFLPISNVMSAENDKDRGIYQEARSLLMRSAMNLEDQFSNFDAVGPFRASPERTYLYSGEAPHEVGRQGENFAQILANSSSSRDRQSQIMVSRVSKWFSGAGIANSIQIRGLTNRHFELCVEDRIGFASNIVDVGFGCSQVLPVVIGGYRLVQNKVDSRPRQPGLFVVQEPEIHLHPSAAAHLGSFFVDLVRNSVQCFVETHSENIVLRVARHIAAGHLKAEDVKIFWVSDDGLERSVTELEFKDDGSFEIEWPEGFFPTRSQEVLALAKSASKISDGGQLELALQW